MIQSFACRQIVEEIYVGRINSVLSNRINIYLGLLATIHQHFKLYETLNRCNKPSIEGNERVGAER